MTMRENLTPEKLADWIQRRSSYLNRERMSLIDNQHWLSLSDIKDEEDRLDAIEHEISMDIDKWEDMTGVDWMDIPF